MSWHCGAFFANNGVNAANTDTPWLNDLGVVPKFNNHALLPGDFLLSAAMVMGASVTRCRLFSGQLRALGFFYLHPTVLAAVPNNNPNLDYRFKQPVHLPQREEIECDFSNNLGAGTEPETCVLFLHKTYDPWPGGNFWIVRFTSTTATVANAWTNIGQPTMEVALPVGTYAMLWWDVQSTNGQNWRWLFPPTVGLRPGLPMLTAISNRNNYDIYQGAFGLAGYFVNDVLPFAEVLANGADASFEGRMAIIRTQSSIGAMTPMGPLGIAGP